MSIEGTNHWRDIEDLARDLYIHAEGRAEIQKTFIVAEKFIQYRDSLRHERAQIGQNEQQKLKKKKTNQ